MSAGDVDIDLYDRSQLLSLLDYVPATIIKNGEPTLHNSGIYLQAIPIDPLSGIAAFDYEQAERKGYFKIDILNASVYAGVRDERHLVELMRPPPWKLLHRQEFLRRFHIWQLGSQAEVIASMKPSTVEELAMSLALIRPAKRHLLHRRWEEIAETIWTKPEQGDYYFKRSHAISYAMAVIVQVNLLVQTQPELLAEYDAA